MLWPFWAKKRLAMLIISDDS